MTRLQEFPLPDDLLPSKLRVLLQPIERDDPHLKVQVAASFEHDMHGDGREALHMLMVAVPSRKAAKLGVLEEASAGGVTGSPGLNRKGILRKYAPSASGFDPIVMSWGTGSYFAYNLSEKVWTSLGLSPRCFGNLNQRIVYDDPSAPEFGVAEGEISNAYYFKASRNVSWTMRNDYLRRYLWARNAVDARAFYYEALLDDREEPRAVMKDEGDYHDEPEGGWYELVLREWKGKLFLRVWASVPTVEPKLCPQR